MKGSGCLQFSRLPTWIHREYFHCIGWQSKMAMYAQSCFVSQRTNLNLLVILGYMPVLQRECNSIKKPNNYSGPENYLRTEFQTYQDSVVAYLLSFTLHSNLELQCVGLGYDDNISFRFDRGSELYVISLTMIQFLIFKLTA